MLKRKCIRGFASGNNYIIQKKDSNIDDMDRTINEIKAQLKRNGNLNYLLEPLPKSKNPEKIIEEVEKRRIRLIKSSLDIDANDFMAATWFLTYQTSSIRLFV